MTSARRVIISADDFGLSEAVNEAVEKAHRDGILSTASLMVAGAAAADAVSRARRLSSLRVGLHLVLVEGPSVLGRHEIPLLLDESGRFPSAQGRLGWRYFASPGIRRQLRAEIRAQLRAFRDTGLRLDHVNAHKHMHLHPTVARLLIDEGRGFHLPAMRVPREPGRVLARLGEAPRLGARMLEAWTSILRAQCRRAGIQTNDWCFGLHWTGGMTAERVERLASSLPPGLSEIYFHPATRRDEAFRCLMPDYAPEAELAALLDPTIPRALDEHSCVRVGWSGP